MRRQVVVIWDLEDDPDGNYAHIVIEHGISQDEVDDVVGDPTNPTTESGSSGRPITFGWTQTGRYLAVVWEYVTDDPYTIKPVTAYEVPPPGDAPGRGRRSGPGGRGGRTRRRR